LIGKIAGGADPDIAVRPGDGVVSGPLETAGEDSSDEAVSAQGMFVPGDRDVGIAFRRSRRQLVQGVDRSDRIPRADLAVELEPEKRVDNRPGVNGRIERIPLLGCRQSELFPPLQKEGAFLRVEK